MGVMTGNMAPPFSQIARIHYLPFIYAITFITFRSGSTSRISAVCIATFTVQKRKPQAEYAPGRRPFDCRFFTGQGRHSDKGDLYARQAGEMTLKC